MGLDIKAINAAKEATKTKFFKLNSDLKTNLGVFITEHERAHSTLTDAIKNAETARDKFYTELLTAQAVNKESIGGLMGVAEVLGANVHAVNTLLVYNVDTGTSHHNSLSSGLNIATSSLNIIGAESSSGLNIETSSLNMIGATSSAATPIIA